MIVTPLIRLTRKDQPFSWEIEVENAFQTLKASFTTTPLLIHVHPSKPFVLETNTSNFALNVVLSQATKDNLLHPIHFHFHKLSPYQK
jgi:hypothetical protein